MKKVLIILASVFVLTGCSKASRVNHNIREDANNFKITRKVVALNTRTNDVTYTCIQTEAKKENPYAYDIQFFPAKEVIENGIIDIKSSEWERIKQWQSLNWTYCKN